MVYFPHCEASVWETGRVPNHLLSLYTAHYKGAALCASCALCSALPQGVKQHLEHSQVLAMCISRKPQVFSVASCSKDQRTFPALVFINPVLKHNNLCLKCFLNHIWNVHVYSLVESQIFLEIIFSRHAPFYYCYITSSFLMLMNIFGVCMLVIILVPFCYVGLNTKQTKEKI